MLIEVGFISDASDTWYMVNRQDELASAIAKGIICSLESENIVDS